jgi:hypothetical protein
VFNGTCTVKNVHECAPDLECISEIFPCSLSIPGNLVLMLFYGLILAKGKQHIGGLSCNLFCRKSNNCRWIRTFDGDT